MSAFDLEEICHGANAMHEAALVLHSVASGLGSEDQTELSAMMAGMVNSIIPQIEATRAMLDKMAGSFPLLSAQEWQDISTAPDWRQGLQVWVYGGRYTEPTTVAADGEYWRFNVGGLTMLPTHWMPLVVPTPPVAVIADERTTNG